MKMKQIFLGLTVVALMAACGKKENTETPAVESPAVEETEMVMEEPAAEAPVAAAPVAATPAKTTPAKAAPKAAEPEKKVEAVDPCEQITKDYEAFADKYVIKMKNRAAGPEALKAAGQVKTEAKSMYEKAQTCLNNATYKARIQKAFLKIQSVK